jgi:N6-adenosine-specific RNA methylase IME4
MSDGDEYAGDRGRSRCPGCHRPPRVLNPIVSSATHGKPHRVNADVAELIIASRREHSRKPDEIYERVERLIAGTYLELFAIAEEPHREGLTHWIGKDRITVGHWKSDSYPGAKVSS